MPTGTAQQYQKMAEKAQCFSRVAHRFNLASQELDGYPIAHGISDNGDQKLLGSRSPQLTRFAEAARRDGLLVPTNPGNRARGLT